jgi:hypothetical protein
VRVLLFFIGVGLLIYAVIDCSRTPVEEVPSGVPKSVWFVLMVIVPIIGPLLWIVASRTNQSSAGGGVRSPRTGPKPGGGPASRRRSGPLGPDDDPDFLRKI